MCIGAFITERQLNVLLYYLELTDLNTFMKLASSTGSSSVCKALADLLVG